MNLKCREKYFKVTFKIGQRNEYFTLTKHHILEMDERKLTIKVKNIFTGVYHDTGYGKEIKLRSQEFARIINNRKLWRLQ